MSINTDKIKTILAGIEGLIDRLPDEKSFYSVGQRRAYELVKNIIYQQFPELLESEDERIRRALIKQFSAISMETWAGIPKIDIIAYLEKQKEQKPALRITKGFYEPDGPQFDIVDQKPAECIEFDNEFKNQVSHLLASVLNREWEYNKEFVEYTAQQLLGYAKHEISPREWSEEDEKMLVGIIERGSAQIPPHEPALRGEQMEWLMNRLKSLRPQPHWKP